MLPTKARGKGDDHGTNRNRNKTDQTLWGKTGNDSRKQRKMEDAFWFSMGVAMWVNHVLCSNSLTMYPRLQNQITVSTHKSLITTHSIHTNINDYEAVHALMYPWVQSIPSTHVSLITTHTIHLSLITTHSIHPYICYITMPFVQTDFFLWFDHLTSLYVFSAEVIRSWSLVINSHGKTIAQNLLSLTLVEI